jgi:methionyl-tRNA synthetase
MAALPKTMAEFIDAFEFRKALYEWIDLAREANKYFDKKTPWKTVKTDVAVCGTTMHCCLRVLRTLAVCGYPFMPAMTKKLWSILGCEGEVAKQDWFTSAEKSLPVGSPLGAIEILFAKIETAQIEAEVARLKQWAADAAKGEKKVEEEKPREYTPLKPTVTYDDFAKLDFRVARILEAEAVPKSKKLVKLQIDLGFEKRQIVAGILEYFKPETLVGRSIIVVANLAPAKLMGVESNGMLLAAKGGSTLTLLTADVAPGSAVS